MFVSESGRLYAFGSGANGQLGTGSCDVKSVPVRVKGPFIAFNKIGTPMDTNSGATFVINTIAAGGDHCILWAVTPEV